MTRMNGRSAHRAWALGAAAIAVVSFAVPFVPLASASAVTTASATAVTTASATAVTTANAARSASVPRAAVAAVVAGTHSPYTLEADECATCHRVHTAQNKNVLKDSAPQSGLCFTCHDGTGASSNVKAQYDSAPANNPAAREYFTHEARVTTSHTQARLEDEFRGVSNRHSECGDCHNPHKANPTASTETANGWTAPGRLAGISGVSVLNTPTVITPTFLDGITNPITLEYQLCFKCHSGFTTMPSNAGFTPSKFLLDKAVEFNPNNPSYHPVEAPGKNTTAKMAAGLAGASPYKQWTFTTGSTIRCSNCHASSTKYNLVTPPAAGSDLPPHTSAYRGILLQNYRNRVLKPSTAAYADADFALCFMCHSNTPFKTETSTATNFGLHGYHLTKISGQGSGGTDIDTPGAGQGNAICAECHFRTHSTSFKDGTQSIPGTRLVNFSPNVTGARQWTGSSCNLTCHGKSH